MQTSSTQPGQLGHSPGMWRRQLLETFPFKILYLKKKKKKKDFVSYGPVYIARGGPVYIARGGVCVCVCVCV
jgi:hypothetical protein